MTSCPTVQKRTSHLKMKLRVLIIIRHGQPDQGDHLNPDARKALIDLGSRLRTEYKLSPETTGFLGSKKLRSIKTMQAIASGAELTSRLGESCHDEFFSNDSVCDVKKALEVIVEFGQRFEILVVVSHLEMMEVLPTAFGDTVDILIPQNRLEFGQGYVINLTHKSYKEIS